MSVLDHVQAIAITPRTPDSLHLTSVPVPPLRPAEALVRVRTVGICGTDRELIAGHLGSPPPGTDELVIGHEVLGVVEQVGPEVTRVAVGDLVSATARRGCGCPTCAAGQSDFCRDLAYTERGIGGLHGFMTERFVEDEANLVVIPPGLAEIGVLVEPASVPEKTWRVAAAVQSRIASWRPETAVVFGAGPIGLLATLMLRSRGLAVYALDIKPAPNPNSEIVTRCGAVYVDTGSRTAAELKDEIANVDLIIECSGSTAPLLDAMRLLGNNGLLLLLSATGGKRELTIPSDVINREFVLGNKAMVGSVNSTPADFAAAIETLGRAETLWPGLAASLITHRYDGLGAALAMTDIQPNTIKAVIDL